MGALISVQAAFDFAVMPFEPGHNDMDMGPRSSAGTVIADVAATVIETRSLTKAFGTHTVLDRLNIQVRRGEIYGLIGSNGAGKSTLIKILTTLLPPTSGEAMVAGYNVMTDAQKVRARIGYVPQLLSADGSLTGYENLLLSARLYLVPRAERENRIREALDMTGLADYAGHLAQTYSGGMLRRLEIAQSTIHRPEILIMDEPTVGLDPVARMTVWDHVRDLRSTFHATILITTHAMEEVDALCDRVAILHAGRLEKVGAPKDLKAEIGPGATLDDVFSHIAGGDIVSAGNYRDARLSRLGAAEHG
jgi:ABC-2 type transport system ATP-binding protein